MGRKFPPRAEFARLLLDRGASTTARCQRGKTPLQVAYESGYIDVCDILIRRYKPAQALNHHDLDDMWNHSFRMWPLEQGAFNFLYDLDAEGFFWKTSKYVMHYMTGQHYDLAWTYLRRKLPSLSPKEKAMISTKRSKVVKLT